MSNDEVQALVEKLNAEDCERGRYDREAAAMLTSLSAEVEALKAEARSKALDYLALDGQVMELQGELAEAVGHLKKLEWEAGLYLEDDSDKRLDDLCSEARAFLAKHKGE